MTTTTRNPRAAALATALALALAAPAAAQGTGGGGPEYDGPETRALVEAMIERQGGMEPWEEAETVTFTHAMYTPKIIQEGDTRWWISHETIHRPTGRVYQEWPVDGARMAWDGERMWAEGWKRPNPPGGMAYIHMTLLFMPWVSQSEGVRLERGEDVTLPTMEAPSHTVNVVRRGGAPLRLFIDPESRGLVGFGMGPAVHVVQRFTEVDGLRVPEDWSTFMNGEAIGHHGALNIDLDGPFDASKLEMPAGAEVVAGS